MKMTRRQRASELMRLLQKGPSFSSLDFGLPGDKAPEAVARKTQLWLDTWVTPLVASLVPECADLQERVAAVAKAETETLPPATLRALEALEKAEGYRLPFAAFQAAAGVKPLAFGPFVTRMLDNSLVVFYHDGNGVSLGYSLTITGKRALDRHRSPEVAPFHSCATGTNRPWRRTEPTG
jgi:hypothetical protein